MSEPSAGVATAIAAASRATGVSLSYLTAAAQRESAFDPDATASTSSAAGLFQFIEATWLSTLEQHAPALGLEDHAELSREQALELRFDPQVSALLAGALTADNADVLRARLGRAPTDGDLYAAHVLGAGGAAELLTTADAQPDRLAADLFPAAAKANQKLFYDDAGAPVTVAALAKRFTVLVGSAIDPSAPARSPDPAASSSVRERTPTHVAGVGRSGVGRGMSALALAPQTIEILARLKPPERADRLDDV